MSQEERGQFANAVAMIYRAGDLNGFVMLDAVRGTANCHSPLLFSTASGSPQPLKVPAPSDPFDLCLYGGVALGDAGGAPFYAQTENDNLETDELKIFARKDAALSQACTISASYEIAYEAAESFCKEPALCSAFAARAAKWAAEFATAGGSIGDPALVRAAEGQAPRAGDGALPLFGAAQSRLVPQAFRFGASEAWFAVKGDPRADFVRIGPAAEGPDGRWRIGRLSPWPSSIKPVSPWPASSSRSGARPSNRSRLKTRRNKAVSIRLNASAVIALGFPKRLPGF